MKRVASLLALALGLVAFPAAADVEVAVAPTLGVDAPASSGWFSYVVRVRGLSPATENGTVELSDGSGGTARAAFAVSHGEQQSVELLGHDVFGKGLELVVRDGSGSIVNRQPVPSSRGREPFLFDLASTSRQATALRDVRVAVQAGIAAWAAPTEGLSLSVKSAGVEPRTGEPILPRRAAGYGSATVVLARSELLVSLAEPDFRALADWVLSGGTLAVALGRPEDLGHARFAALHAAGATLDEQAPAARITEFAIVEPAPPGSGGASSYVTKRIAPAEDVTRRLSGFHGGALAGTRWGAKVAHGLGEVHLLAFDPNAPVFVDDAWVRASMVDLVRDAWERRARIAFAGGVAPLDGSRTDPARKILDPNEASQWTVGLSAIALLVYALLAIPIVFRRASRRNDPLRALVELPLFSLGTLAFIVAIGAAARGGRARARRIAILECASGADRCAAVRLRGLFASSADTLRVASTGPGDVLDVVSEGHGVTRALVLDREGARLEDLHGRPWETVVVREDGFSTLAGAVSFRGTGASTEIVNGTDGDLVAAVAHAPGGDLRFFPRIPRGASVRIADGKPLGTVTAAPLPPAPKGAPRAQHRLEAYRFATELDGASEGLGALWSALEFMGAEEADYWPDDAPAVIAELPGGERVPDDSGLKVDKDRRFVRVLGVPAP